MGITLGDLKAEYVADLFVEKLKKGDKITMDEWLWAIDAVKLTNPDIKSIIDSNQEYVNQLIKLGNDMGYNFYPIK
jgi:hypothetical protein